MTLQTKQMSSKLQSATRSMCGNCPTLGDWRPRRKL